MYDEKRRKNVWQLLWLGVIHVLKFFIATWLVGWGKYLSQGIVIINQHTLLSVLIVFWMLGKIQKVKHWVITLSICIALMIMSAFSDYYQDAKAVQELEDLLALLLIVAVSLYIFFGMKAPEVTQVILQKKILRKLQDEN